MQTQQPILAERPSPFSSHLWARYWRESPLGELQAVCGHRGLPAGDRHHMDSRKGPTKEAVELLDHLEGLYRRKVQSPQAAFDA